MNVVEVPISDLKEYEHNAKYHSPEQIDALAESIKLTKGLKQNIVIDRDNVIVAGHGRVLAAEQLGYETVPCVYADDMTEEEIRAYRLIDNKISAMTGIDFETELAELDKINFDMEPFGFEIMPEFSLDDIEDNNDVEGNGNDYFTTKLTFPMSKKKQVSAYLREHKEDICREIIERSEK